MKSKLALSVFFSLMMLSISGCKLECDEWYEAQDGECVEIREQFYGTYTGTVTSNGQSANGQTVISAGNSGANSLFFLLQTGNSNILLNDENGSFSIPLQNVYYQGLTMSIEGSGSFSGNQLVMNYIGTYQGSNVTVNFTGTK